MLRFSKNLLSLYSLAAICISTSAFAIPGIEAGLMVGGMRTILNTPDLGSAASVSGGTGVSAGATAGVGPLEISALYSQYKMHSQVLGLGVDAQSNYLDLPVLLRIGAGPASIGLGGFYSVRLSSDDQATNNSNYGATASVRISIPTSNLFIDGRYQLGLKDVSGTKTSGLALYLGYAFL